MSNTVVVNDKQLTGKVYRQIKLVIDESQITLKDLIIERVLQETTNHNTHSLEKVFTGLVNPADESAGMVDAEKQISIALKGFQENRFFVLVNDRQISSLDEMLSIDNKTRVSFIKLVPLIGG
ncbi:hypothetical protein [Sulfurovum mangrovi]|uniref:hypothetical protein n=1 Tax=Sulfurovum mangrovi TaxID=2893889 RepID=UPI001E353445|nr:hypothetical protein [Sulfurovum mangrovi]UFH60294.1 hypothetical protein LN246_05445 [Sulfurovum mangrovi]